MAFSSTLPHYTPAAGKGIPFDHITTLLANDNAMQSDPTTMAWYASSTWTPFLAGSGGQSGQVYSSQVGHYVKIGSLYFVRGRITLSTLGTITGAVLIGGLPATVLSNGYAPASIGLYANFNSGFTSLGGYCDSGTTHIVLQGNKTAATASATIAQTDLVNTSDFVFGAMFISA